MEDTTKNIQVTGTGEIGGPRPGAKGIQRVPLASLSDDRRGQQVAEQACSSSRATGSAEMGKRREMKIIISEDSSSDDSFPPKKGSASKRRKRTVPSTTPPASDVEMCLGSDRGGRRSVEKPRAPPPSKARKRLPTEEKRLAEIRHVPTANLAVNILEVADSIEQMAATAGNLKGTYIRRLRDDAGKARASVTELAKRTKVTGALAALKQENLQLRARLHKADQEIEQLKEKNRQSEREKEKEKGKGKGEDERGKGGRATEPPTERIGQQAGPEEVNRDDHGMRREIQSLAEQVKALR